MFWVSFARKFTFFVLNLILFVVISFSLYFINDDTANGKDVGKLSGRIIDSDMHDVGRFLNRLLGLPPDIQNRYYE